MSDIIITERQLALLTKQNSSDRINEATGWNTLADFVGIVDPTGIVDFGNAMSYFYQGDHLFGLLSLISAVPYAGDLVAKPVMGALKIGSAATKELRVAMDLAKVGKTAEASASLAKLAKEPGVVGKFLRNAESWAPKVAEKVEMMPGGPLKGLKNVILDYLKLFERAGAKSAKFGSEAAKLAKDVVTPAKQLENIKYLQGIMKNEPIWKSTNFLKSGAEGLTKRGGLSQIFLGGAPRLFGNRRMRILMRQTKWWLGFLDYIGVGNFVGPEELASQMSDDEIKKRMEDYNKTQEAQQYANQDFGNQNLNPTTPQTSTTPEITTKTDNNANPFSDWLGGLFKSQVAKGVFTAL